MIDQINNILNDLNNDLIDVNDAIKKINKIEYHDNQIIANNKAKKIKIKIHDKESNKKINLPKFSIKFLSTMTSFGFKFVINKSDDIPKNLDTKLVKNLLRELSNHPPFSLVEVESPEAEIQIYTC